MINFLNKYVNTPLRAATLVVVGVVACLAIYMSALLLLFKIFGSTGGVLIIIVAALTTIFIAVYYGFKNDQANGGSE